MKKNKRLEEKCGIVGVFTNKFTTNLPLALHAAGGVQHRGQQGTGVAIKTKRKFLIHRDDGLIQQVFTADKIKKYNQPCQWIVIHCRYGTSGAYYKENLQPCIATSSKGEQAAIVHNGEFADISQLKKKLKGKIKTGTSDTYLFSKLLSQTKGKNWDERISKALSDTKGAYSLIIGVKDALFVARDQFGIRPLIVGKIPNGWLVASETHAFDKVGAKVAREVKNGEILKITKKGLKIIKKGSDRSHFCDFEWAYFSKPNSLLPTHEQKDEYKNPDSWLSITEFRERCGYIMAKEAPIAKATFVVGIPDSGVSVATGYSNALNIPYRQVVIRDHHDPNGIQRLFMRDDQKENICKKVLGKLSLVPDKAIWKNAIVVVGDDSIVRGNVSKQITKAIFSLGAKEVHWIIGFPIVIHRCHLGVSIRTREELVAMRNDADPVKIAKAIGASSVHYISPLGLIQARLLSTKARIPKNSKEVFLVNGGCGGCITGLYPVSRSGEIYEIKNLPEGKIPTPQAKNQEGNFVFATSS